MWVMQRLLIAGYGDIARRTAARLPDGVELRKLARGLGVDFDRPETLGAIAGWADAVLYCAPPPEQGVHDTRVANFLDALERGILPVRLVYLSTSGVYGDCAGARVDEERALDPRTARAVRRADAERRLALWCSSQGVALVVLRVPGIYAADRLPLERLRAGTPVLRAEDDVYTNHIHADDLAAICVRALRDDAAPGVYNACDDSELKMGEWFDLIADRAGLPRPPRIARQDAATRIAPQLLSFMSESRRLSNAKLKRAWGLRLAYPTVFDGVPRRIGVATA
jgi:nucleoside-diphosphate-sugar epimerase